MQMPPASAGGYSSTMGARSLGGPSVLGRGSLTAEGHSMVVDRTTSGRRWRWSCECGAGWHQEGDPTRATELEALRSCVHHGRNVKRAMAVERGAGSTNVSLQDAMLLP